MYVEHLEKSLLFQKLTCPKEPEKPCQFATTGYIDVAAFVCDMCNWGRGPGGADSEMPLHSANNKRPATVGGFLEPDELWHDVWERFHLKWHIKAIIVFTIVAAECCWCGRTTKFHLIDCNCIFAHFHAIDVDGVKIDGICGDQIQRMRVMLKF